MSNVGVYVDPKVHKVIELYPDIFAGDFHSLPIGTQLVLQAGRLTEAHQNHDDSVWQGGTYLGPGGGFLDNGSAFGVYPRLDLCKATERTEQFLREGK